MDLGTFNVHEDFFRFDFKIKGKRFKVDLDKFLQARRNKDNELTKDEIEYLLESCASWRQSFWSAYVEASDIKKEKEDELEREKALWYEEAKKEVIKSLKKQNNNKITSTMLSGISKDEINSKIISMHKKEYFELQDEIREWGKNSKLLFGTHQNLVSRGMELQSLYRPRDKFKGEIKEYGSYELR